MYRPSIPSRLGRTGNPRMVCAALVALILLLTASSAVFGYLYRAPIAITENASTSYAMVPVLWDSNNSWMAANGFMNTTANDTRVQTLAGSNKPWMVADNKTLTSIPVPADSQTNLYFVTGESEVSAMDIIVGYGGYITIPYDAAMDCGDNFSIEFGGYFDTSASMIGEDLLRSEGTARIYISAAEEITGEILDSDTDTLRPEANGHSVALTPNAGTNWDAVNEAVSDDDGTYVHYITGQADYYEIPDTTLSTITSVQVWVNAKNASGGARTVTPRLYIGTTVYSGDAVAVTQAGPYETSSYTWNTNPDTSAAWESSDIADLEIGVSVSGTDLRVTQCWVVLSGSSALASVSAAGVTSGYHDIILTQDAGSGTPVIRPDGVGNYTNIASASPAVAHYLNVDEVTADGFSTYLSTASAVQQLDSYNLTLPAFLGDDQVITSVTVHWNGRNSVANGKFQPLVRLGGVDVLGTDTALTGDFAAYSEALTRPGGGSWVSADFTDLEAGGGLTATGGTSMLTQLYVSIAYTYTSDLDIYVDAVLEDSDAHTTVPVSGNDWVIMSNATPYLDYYKHYVGGTLIAWYEPNDIILTTVMPDRAGAAQDGVITWGANPAGVGATLGSLSSSGQPSIGGTSDTSTSDILPVVGGTDWRPDAGVSPELLANPMRPIVTAISDNTTLSEYQVWVWFGIIFVVFITVLVGANVRGHHLITGIAASAAIILMVVWTVFPFLSLLVVVLAILGGLVSERSPSL